MLTLNDGRSELWQWDTGRKLTVDADCTQVHFSNKFFGRSVDVDVFDGTAEIPDVLLQVDKDLLVWAFVGTAENGYTKISKVFKVNKRNKPADYVFTPTEQTTLDEIMKRLSQIEESQDSDAIKKAVDDYLANNPIEIEEIDPTVPDWAKKAEKPNYTAKEVGAVATVNGISPDANGNVEIPVSGGNVDLTGYATEQYVKDYAQPKGNYLTEVPEGYAKTEDIPTKPEDIGAQPEGDYALRSEIPSVPVKSVNGKTGAVSLTATDVKARPDSWMPTASDVGALPSSTVIPTVPTKVSEFTNDAGYLTEHQDLSEYAKKTEIPSVPVKSVNGKTGAVSLTASDVGALPSTTVIPTVPTKLSAFTNDSGFITGYTETDPTVPAWAKQSTKPSYSKSEVGLGNVDNVKQYSASNPPPYPVTSVNGKTGAVTVTVPTKVSQLQNDSGYLTGHRDTSLTMFIAPDGSDSNDGLTADKPKKTVKACVNAGATRISAKRGVYAEQVAISNIGGLEIFPTDNDQEYSTDADWPPIVFDLSDTIAVGSLAAYNSIKRVAYSNSANEQFDKVFTKQSQPPVTDTYGSRYNATVWLMSNDEKTVCKKLKPVLTVAECEAETNTFSWVGGYLYINADMTGVEKICVPTNWDSGFRIDNVGKVILREVEVRFSGAYNLWILNCPYFDLYKCSARYSSYASGIDIDNANGTLTACYATKNFDGFGISGYGHTTFTDCVAEFNFDDGVSHHNGSCGTFIGGRYEGNGKGGNTPAYGAQVNIYGGIYKDNASFGIGYLYTSTKNPAGGMVQGAVMVGNPIGLNVDANCTVTAINCLYKDNAIDKKASGNLVEYNPDYVKTVNGVKADENGNVKIEVSGGESGEDTNLLHSAINTDKSEYVGVNGEDGYKVNRRLSSSAATTDYEKDSEQNCCTGYISAAQGEVFRVENSTFEASGYSCIYFFDSTFKLITGVGIASSAMKSLYVDGVLSFTVPSNTSIAYVRICTGVISDATVITKTA